MMRCVHIAILMSVLVTSTVQQHGRQVSNCVWVYDDDQILDLTTAGNTDGTARWNNKTALYVDEDPNLYTINPCYGFSLGSVCQDVTVCRISQTGIPLNVAAASSGLMYYSEAEQQVLLEYNHTDPSDPNLLYISQFKPVCSGEEEPDIIIQQRSMSTSQVVHHFLLLLTCAPSLAPITTAGPPTVTPQPIKTLATTAPPASVSLHPIKTPSAPVTHASIRPPPKPATHNLTPGGVLCIIFVCCFCGYFLIGSIYMFCFSGAKGIEIIPHVHFWLDLPNLILDGFFFVFSCCGKTQMVTSPASDYDKI